MTLARKLTLIFALLTSALLTTEILLQLDHELADIESDLRAKHRLLGRALAGAVTNTWQQQGEGAARALLDDTRRFQERVAIRWVWLDGGTPQDAPEVESARLESLNRVGFLQFSVGDHLVSYVPTNAAGRPGAIELSEPVLHRAQAAMRRAREVVISGLLLAVVFLFAAVVIGRRLIARPVEELVRTARQLGLGNLKTRAKLTGRDEFGELAQAMNQMASGLEEANARLVAETMARIEAQEGLRQADRLNTVGMLAAGVAHELGTPLNVVDARAKMIVSKEAQADEAVLCAQIIVGQAAAMSRIVHQVLDFARRRPPRRTIEPLQPLVARTLTLLAPLAAKRDVKLVERVGPEVKALIDSNGMQQVLTNLVVNAIQAMPRAGDVSVGTRVERRAPPPGVSGPARDWLRIDVEDQGHGIAPAALPHVFEPFFTTKGVGEGTGLGLSVAYGIVQDHGGWVAVGSVVGAGTQVSVYLPVDPGP